MYLLEFLSNEFNEKQVVYGEIEFEIHLLKEVKWLDQFTLHYALD